MSTKLFKRIPFFTSFNTFFLFASVFVVYLFVFLEQSANYRLNDSLFAFLAGTLFILYLLFKGKLTLPLVTTITLALFLVWQLITLFFSRDIGVSLWATAPIIGVMMLFLMTYSILSQEKSRLHDLHIYIVSLGELLVVYDLVTFLLNNGIANHQVFAGSFLWHNQAAGLLLFLIPLTLALLIRRQTKQTLFLLSILFIINVFALILTSSRGGWISLILGLCVFFILTFRSMRKYGKLLAILTTIIFILSAISIRGTQLTQRLTSIGNELSSQTQDVSAKTRVAVWQDALTMISASPLVGMGTGTFGTMMETYETQPWLYSANAHDYFLEIAVDNGIPALIFFLIFLASIILPTQKTAIHFFNKAQDNSVFAGFLAAWIGALAHTLIDIDWSRISLLLLFWLCCAALLSLCKTSKFVVEEKGKIYLAYVAVLLFLFITTLGILSASNFNQAAQASNITEQQNYLAAAIQFDPYDEKYYFNQALLLINQGKWTDARAQLVLAKKINSSDSDIYYLLGYSYCQQRQESLCQTYIKKAISISPYKDPTYYILLAKSYLMTNNQMAVRKLLSHAITYSFPINENFRMYKYLYDYTGLTKNLKSLYLLLATLDVQGGNTTASRHLLAISKTL